MWNKIKSLWTRPVPKQTRLAQIILDYADLLEEGETTIHEITNAWNKMRFTSSIHHSALEIQLMSEAVGDLIELHYSCVGHSDKVFAHRLREIVFRYGSGIN